MSFEINTPKSKRNEYINPDRHTYMNMDSLWQYHITFKYI